MCAKVWNNLCKRLCRSFNRFAQKFPPAVRPHGRNGPVRAAGPCSKTLISSTRTVPLTFAQRFARTFARAFPNRSKLLHTLLLNAVLFFARNFCSNFCSIFCSHFCSHFCALASLGPSSVGSLCVGPLFGHPCWRFSSLRDCPTRIKASISDPACRPTTCSCSRLVEKSHLEKCIFVNARFCSSRSFYH